MALPDSEPSMPLECFTYMKFVKQSETFIKLVVNRFNLYNSLFLSLPFPIIIKTGNLLPILSDHCRKGLDAGMDPNEILDSFFEKHTELKSLEDRIDFMFNVIQYVERQIVLFDSIEDASFSQIKGDGNQLNLEDFLNLSHTSAIRKSILEKLSGFSARLVFTAHPTQFYPPAVLDIIEQLRIQILKNNIGEIETILTQLGMTPLICREKPTPLDEAKSIIYYLRNVYYDTVAEIFLELQQRFNVADFANHQIVKLGFWPGGDRDGNPFVTADVTLKVADELRMALMQCYYRDIEELSHKLTFRNVEEKLSSLRQLIYPAMYDAEKLISYSDIIGLLEEIKKIVNTEYTGIYQDLIQSLITKVNIFKTHFATLDIRQHHDVHRQTVEAVLRKEKLIKKSLDELSEKQLSDILLHQQIDINPKSFPAGVIRDTLLNMWQIALIQSRNGEEGCNRYIISNSEDANAVLFVFALLRWSFWKTGNIPVDIIPLFESMEGMKNAPSIMQSLFDIPAYRLHIESRNQTQTIMLGFSDGTKDGGYLKANWSIFKTREALSKVCNQNGIKAIFFDGRGGPPARGGGKTHRFYAAQSKEIANHEIQLTIQGQTISSRYGTPEHFQFNVEQLITAALAHHLKSNENAVSEDSRKLMDMIADISYLKYQELKQHPKFIPYLENKSTLRFYSSVNIGSRPVKRGNKKELTLDDLRAIPFVGSWSQLKQNVPGFYGVGSALKALEKEGRLKELKDLFNDFPYFKALILNSMMALSKSNFKLTSYLAKDPEFGDFWKLLNDEYELSKKMMLLVSGYHELMEEEPVTNKSIEVRERIVLPLLVIQQYALQMLGTGEGFKESWEKLVTRSLYGNINASRNSA